MTTPESASALALSTIGRGTTIRGSIRGDGDLDIHGYVEGAVTLDGELQISETALIKSDVSARRVIVRGAVAGNISATELIVLEPGSRVVGDVGAPQIGIRPGALVRGNVATGGPLKPRAVQAAAPASAQAQRGRAAPASAPARPAPAAHAPAARAAAPAPAARPAPPAPAARPAAPVAARPAPVRTPPAPPAPVAPVEEEPAVEEVPAAVEEAVEQAAADESSGPPPPVVPAVPKGAKAQVRRGRGASK